MKDKRAQGEPPRVLERAKQGGEIRARWAWVEERVWTERMLTALEEGVKGGVWFSLMDKVYAMRNLRAAFAKVKRNAGAAGADHQTIAMFERQLDANLEQLSNELRAGTYRPQQVRRVWIPKPGKPNERRPLGIPTIRDRVVQTALRNVLEPIFEREFAEQSYGFRPRRGCQDALRRVDALLKEGYTQVLDADLKSYFDTIPWKPLLARVSAQVADGRVLTILEAFLNQKVMDGMKEWTPEAGLTLHPEKTRIVDATQTGGFDFLGYHFERGRKWPSQKSQRKLKDTLRPLTKRANGRSLDALIAKVNPILRGWFGYFKHGLRYSLERLDKWLRRRLRSLLRKRMKRRGMARGRENVEWPNRFFAEAGLFSLADALAQARQSSRR